MSEVGQKIIARLRRFTAQLRVGRGPDNAITRNKAELARLGRLLREAESGKFLLEDGDIICRDCRRPGDELEIAFFKGETYADAPCDRCGE